MNVSERIMYGPQDKCASTAAAVMVNATTIFTFNTPLVILVLFSICVTANDATASTLLWRFEPTVGSANPISNPTASLANATAGTTINLNQTSLVTAPDIVTALAGGVQLLATTNRIILPAGKLVTTMAVGSTTGTWRHYLRYAPLSTEGLVT